MIKEPELVHGCVDHVGAPAQGCMRCIDRLKLNERKMAAHKKKLAVEKAKEKKRAKKL